MMAAIEEKGLKGYFINATQSAKDLGNVLLTNVVMLGAFTEITDVLPADVVLNKLLSIVDLKYQETDVLAFNYGRNLIKAQGENHQSCR
jgi:indolepyruvate ferredoxin oxidoreductase beta subunit